jgi:uncharacterized membrane protein
MAWLDITVWTFAFLLFVVGDWATTRYGLARGGLVERNPLARRAIDRFGVTASLLLLKSIALAVAMAGYLYAAGDADTRSYRLLFPVLVFLVGLVTTVSNLWVLATNLDSG